MATNITIQQLLEMPIGTKTGGGFIMTVKIAGKRVQVKDYWIQNVTLTDPTGDMLADIILHGNVPIVKGRELKIIVCVIQPISDGKKLLVHEWEKITCTADEYEAKKQVARPQQIGPDWEAIGRGKVKCVLSEACIGRGIPVLGDGSDGEYARECVAKLADWVMSPEDTYNA